MQLKGCGFVRQYAILREPIQLDDEWIYKIMLYQNHTDVYLFEYCSLDTNICSYDLWYPDLDSAYCEWNAKTDGQGWIDIDDPCPTASRMLFCRFV